MEPPKSKKRPRTTQPDPRIKKYRRTGGVKIDDEKDKKLKAHLRKTNRFARNAARSAALEEILQTEEAGYLEGEGLDKTFKFRQEDIVRNVDMQSQVKACDLSLPTFGPYCMRYSRDGRYSVLGGAKGHISVIDWHSHKPKTELHVRETVRDATFLHNDDLFAVAQRKYTYIYDSTGTEIHCMKKHLEVQRLGYLPYHFLLVSVGRTGYLKYQDTSTGDLVAEMRTKLGCCSVMEQNPSNAIVCLGHSNGSVTMWSPNITKPVVRMFCHRGAVRAMAISSDGNSIATAGSDGWMRIWDLRTFKERHAYQSIRPATAMAISQRGLLAVAAGPHVQIWPAGALQTKVADPYMSNLMEGTEVVSLSFRPFEDVLGVGHGQGVSTMIVPGAGVANIDSFKDNPYSTSKQRKETVVHSLLDKIPSTMISLREEEGAGTVDTASKDVIEKERKAEVLARLEGKASVDKKKMRGRNKSAKRYLKKRKNIITKEKELLKEKLKQEQLERRRAKGAVVEVKKTGLAGVLQRFEPTKNNS